VTTWIIVICVAAFVLQTVTPVITRVGAFTIADAVYGGQVWRFITFQFLHGGLTHIVFNVIGLVIFGEMIERKLGKARFLALYLLCGCAGAAGYAVLQLLGIVAGTSEATLVGASAGLFGCIAAAMKLLPDRILNLAIPPIDITVFRFGAVYLALAAFIVIFHGDTRGSNAGGEAAHLGGAIIGWVLASRLGWLAWADRLVPGRLRMPGRRRGASKSQLPEGWKYHGWR